MKPTNKAETGTETETDNPPSKLDVIHAALEALAADVALIRRALPFALPANNLPPDLKIMRDDAVRDYKKSIKDQPFCPRLVRDREQTLLHLFDKQARLSRGKKLSQTYSKAIIQPILEDPWEIVPRSILKNRCTLRKVFFPRPGETTASEVFEATIKGLLDAKKLFLSTPEELGLAESVTFMLLSPKFAKRHKLPGTLRGFTVEQEDTEPEDLDTAHEPDDGEGEGEEAPRRPLVWPDDGDDDTEDDTEDDAEVGDEDYVPDDFEETQGPPRREVTGWNVQR